MRTNFVTSNTVVKPSSFARRAKKTRDIAAALALASAPLTMCLPSCESKIKAAAISHVISPQKVGASVKKFALDMVRMIAPPL